MSEKRPGPDGVSNVTFPREWGEPPKGEKELRRWILENIEKRRVDVGTASASGSPRAADVGRVSKRG